MGPSHVTEEAALALPVIIGLVWAVATLVIGFASKRPRNHWIRQRARAKRRMAAAA